MFLFLLILIYNYIIIKDLILIKNNLNKNKLNKVFKILLIKNKLKSLLKLYILY
jgi:hypothetical protein